MRRATLSTCDELSNLLAMNSLSNKIAIDANIIYMVTFIQCPATMEGSKIGCNNCGGSRGALCTRKDRDYVVTFPAHGSGKKSIASNQ